MQVLPARAQIASVHDTGDAIAGEMLLSIPVRRILAHHHPALDGKPARNRILQRPRHAVPRQVGLAVRMVLGRRVDGQLRRQGQVRGRDRMEKLLCLLHGPIRIILFDRIVLVVSHQA